MKRTRVPFKRRLRRLLPFLNGTPRLIVLVLENDQRDLRVRVGVRVRADGYTMVARDVPDREPAQPSLGATTLSRHS